MERTQIYLTQDERTALRRLVKRTGRAQSELIRTALDEYLARQEELVAGTAIQNAAGLWQTRADLPDFAALREDWHRG